MYATNNPKTKRELKKWIADGKRVFVYSPGPFPPVDNGIEYVEGPHYPAAHTWYARVEVKHGRITKVLG